MSEQSTVVLVHGAWHGAWCWDEVVSRLSGDGLSVVAIDLPSVASGGVFPRAASACSMKPNRRSNFALVMRKTASGSASRWRARLTTANKRSPASAPASTFSPSSSAASISSASSRIFASTARGSFQSKPTLLAFCCSLSARVSAGRATGTPASAPSGSAVASPR